MKIALAGPSGTGKTTLANYIEKTYKVPFVSQSAYHIFTEEDKEVLRSLGYKETGHKEVVELSMSNPKFAEEFQTRLLLRRGEFIGAHDNFVIDRSPLDNLAYFMYQSSFQATPKLTEAFIDKVLGYLSGLDVLILIPVNNPGSIEDNGSRVANWYFQRMMSSIFEHVFEAYKIGRHVRNYTLDQWSLKYRKTQIDKIMAWLS